jgi:hypothetical protein
MKSLVKYLIKIFFRSNNFCKKVTINLPNRFYFRHYKQQCIVKLVYNYYIKILLDKNIYNVI